MVIRFVRFNIYLLCLTLLASATGCRSPESRRAKQLATLRVHLEVNRLMGELSESVPIMRANPVMVTVQKVPFLTEANVTKAAVVTDSLGGFALQVQFDTQGTQLLEQYTAMNPGRRLAIDAEFGDKPVQHRWLAAPLVMRRVGNGMLTFTPDASRDEAEQIARGLNNVAIKEGNQEKPKKSKAKVE